jgi:hypothetical protein
VGDVCQNLMPEQPRLTSTMGQCKRFFRRNKS